MSQILSKNKEKFQKRVFKVIKYFLKKQDNKKQQYSWKAYKKYENIKSIHYWRLADIFLGTNRRKDFFFFFFDKYIKLVFNFLFLLFRDSCFKINARNDLEISILVNNFVECAKTSVLREYKKFFYKFRICNFRNSVLSIYT